MTVLGSSHQHHDSFQQPVSATPAWSADNWQQVVQDELAQFLDWCKPHQHCAELAVWMDELPESARLTLRWWAYRSYLAYVLGDWDTIADGLEIWESHTMGRGSAHDTVLFSLVGASVTYAEGEWVTALRECCRAWQQVFAVVWTHPFWALVLGQVFALYQKALTRNRATSFRRFGLWASACGVAAISALRYTSSRNTLWFLWQARHLKHIPSDSPKELIEALSQLHQQFPGQTLLHNAMANAHLALDNITQATCWAADSVQRYPLSAKTWVQLGELYEHQQQPQQALEAYQSSMAYGPENPVLWMRLGRLHLQLKQSLVTAASMFKQALLTAKTDSGKADAAFALAQCTLMESTQPESLATADGLMTKAVQWAETNTDMMHALAAVKFQRHLYAEAEELYHQLMELQPNNPQLTCSLGYLCWLQGNTDDAAYYYRQAIIQDPGYDVAYNNLGVVYLEDKNDAERALNLFEKAVDCNLDYATAHYNLGRCYRVLGDTFKAATCFQWAKQLSGASEELDGVYLDTELQNLFKVS